VLALLISFDEIVVSLFMSGGGHSTLARSIFNALRDQVDPTISTISMIIVVITLLLLVLTQCVDAGRRRELRRRGVRPRSCGQRRGRR
jgi:putative spermidine/putrescine transport system permease protein